MPEGKGKLSIPSDHPRKYSCQKQTSRYLGLSVWFWLSGRSWALHFAQHHLQRGSSCHHRSSSGMGCASPSGICSGAKSSRKPCWWPVYRWLSCPGSHHQQAAGILYCKSFPDAWNVPENHGLGKREGCDKVDRSLSLPTCRMQSLSDAVLSEQEQALGQPQHRAGCNSPTWK